MFLLNINNTHVSESILLYIYKNKNLLLPEQNLNCIVNKIKNNEVNILLGYGIYKFKYEDTIIEIDYREEGNSKALEGGRIDYFKRLIIIGDDEETLKKFIIKALDKEEIVSNEMTDIFISRACGFITNYSILSLVPYDILQDPPVIGWIDGYEIVNPIVTNENQAHVKILH